MTGIYNKLESRVKTVEDAVRLLTDLAIRADERMDGADERMDGAEERMDGAEERMNGFDYGLTNVSVKLEALTEAQLRTEAALTRLAEAQAHSDQRLDALINIVREDREGHNGH